MTQPPERFRPLPPEVSAYLDRLRAFVSQLAGKLFPEAHLSRERSDLLILQRVIDANVLRPDQTLALQALGVAFGDALADMIDGLAWCEVTDEFGTDPTLRFRETSFQVNAMTMISKRIESGKPVDLEKLAAQTAATLSDFQRA